MDPEKTLPGVAVRSLGESAGIENLPTDVPAVIHFLDGARKGDLVGIRGTVRVGRGDKNDLIISDRNVSTLHAMIEMSGLARFRIRDLESRNGTFVNGERVTDRLLEDGDVVVLGGAVLKFLSTGMVPDGETAPVESSAPKRPPAGSRRKRVGVPPEQV